MKRLYIHTKNPDSEQKARQFALRFYSQKPDTLRYAFYMNMLKLAYIRIQKS